MLPLSSLPNVTDGTRHQIRMRVRLSHFQGLAWPFAPCRLSSPARSSIRQTVPETAFSGTVQTLFP